MSTTTILVEIIIVGTQVSIWLALLILTLLDYRWIDLVFLEKWTTVFTAITIPIIYSIGAIFDMLIHNLFSWLNSTVLKSYIKHIPDFRAKLLSCISKDNEISKMLVERQSRVRVLRASSLNSFLITVSALAFTLYRISAPSWLLIS